VKKNYTFRATPRPQKKKEVPSHKRGGRGGAKPKNAEIKKGVGFGGTSKKKTRGKTGRTPMGGETPWGLGVQGN